MKFSVSHRFLRQSVRKRRSQFDDPNLIETHRFFLVNNAKNMERRELISLVRMAERMAIDQKRTAWVPYHAEAISKLIEATNQHLLEPGLNLKKNVATIRCSRATFFLPRNHAHLSATAQQRIGELGLLMEDIADDVSALTDKIRRGAAENADLAEQTA